MRLTLEEIGAEALKLLAREIPESEGVQLEAPGQQFADESGVPAGTILHRAIDADRRLSMLLFVTPDAEGAEQLVLASAVKSNPKISWVRLKIKPEEWDMPMEEFSLRYLQPLSIFFVNRFAPEVWPRKLAAMKATIDSIADKQPDERLI